MVISSRTRKRLWARAGNRCTLCKCYLVEARQAGPGDIIVGEEAHIVSAKSNGPRHRHLAPNQVDGYENLLLLCRNDHRRVDDEPEFYTEESLREAKRRHETSIDQTINRSMGGKKSLHDAFRDSVLHRIRSGAELVEVLYETLANSWGKPVELGLEGVAAGEFSDFVNELSDVLPSMSFEARAKTEVVLTARIQKLEAQGLFLYGKKLRLMTSVPGGEEELLTAVLRFTEVDHDVFIDLGLVPRELLLA